MTQTVLQGDSIPITGSECGSAYFKLEEDSSCAYYVESLLFGNDSAINGLFSGDCPNLFYNYVTACSSEIDSEEVCT